jgi:signal transduction histidine kinase
MADVKVSILIVDDRPEQLLALEAVLEDLHLDIVRAYNGRDALRQVLNRDFAVILLDVNMPGIDGFETAQLIRQRRSSAHVPIIFLTAMGDDVYIARGYELGAVDYILTPVVPQVLRSKVAVFVDLFRKTMQVQTQAERLRQHATQLHRLSTASLAINSAQSIDRIVRVATDQAREVVGAHQAMTTMTPGQAVPKLLNFASFSDKYVIRPQVAPSLEQHPVLALAWASSKPIRMSQQELEAQAPPLAAHEIIPLRGLLAAPLTLRDGRCMGLIALSDKYEGEFNDDDQAVLVQLAQMASVAIENTIYAEEREANRLKDEFLSTVSHELRTPLNVISTWAQLLKIDSSPGNINHGLTVIERNVRAQTKLIEDLLDLSRITSGKLRLSLRPMNLASVVESAADALRPIVEEKGIALEYLIETAQPMVNCDPDRMQQVVWNLLSNAAKFTPRGGKITVCLKDAGDLLRLTVADTGEGIDRDFLPYVFERFRQADSSSSRRYTGLGIGLNIVRHIVQLHGGDVTAESLGRGRGATFTITMPRAAVVRSSNAEPPSDRSDQGTETISLQGLRVLLVDDDADAREVVAQILRRHEADVATAEGTDQALGMAASERFDVVVTDLAMPGQDGFVLLHRLRAQSNGHASVPALALTAYAHPEDRVRVMAAGFSGHLPKPVDPADLIRAVHAHGRRESAPDPSTSSADAQGLSHRAPSLA